MCRLSINQGELWLAMVDMGGLMVKPLIATKPATKRHHPPLEIVKRFGQLGA
jgi:hypothetical protein